MKTNKLRVIQDYEKLSTELKEQIKLVYPEGYSEHLIEFKNNKGEYVSALAFETDEKFYMIRMSIRVAEQIILDDEDYDDDGNLKDDIKDKYEVEHAAVEYLAENENYEDPDEDSKK